MLDAVFVAIIDSAMYLSSVSSAFIFLVLGIVSMFIKPLLLSVALSLSSNIVVAKQKDEYIKIIESVVRQTMDCRIRRFFSVPYDVSNKNGVVVSIPIFLDAKKTVFIVRVFVDVRLGG